MSKKKMSAAERDELEWVLAGLASYATLERKAVDEVGWIMLKMSCGRAKAARLIAKARAMQSGGDKA